MVVPGALIIANLPQFNSIYPNLTLYAPYCGAFVLSLLSGRNTYNSPGQENLDLNSSNTGIERMNFGKILAVLCLTTPLIACESMYVDDGIPRIRSQKDVDEYNATVSSNGEKLVCTRERVVGSNFRQYFCMTQNQRDRLATQTREDLDATFQ
mgnify:CR=1 FL=1